MSSSASNAARPPSVYLSIAAMAPRCPQGEGGRPSQPDSIAKNPLADPRPESTRRNYVNTRGQQGLQIALQASQIQKAAAGFEIDQEIDVALFVVLSSCHGPEDTNIPRSAPGCGAEDRVFQFQQMGKVHGVLPKVGSQFDCTVSGSDYDCPCCCATQLILAIADGPSPVNSRRRHTGNCPSSRG